MDSYEESSKETSKVPHSVSDHVIKPNVVVSHTKDGVEVIHLYTGRTLCKLSMQSRATEGEGILYADVNGDGIVDKIQAVVGFKNQAAAPSGSRLKILKEQENRGSCYAYAISGIPSSDMLFNVSLCTRGSALELNSENENLKGLNRVFAELTFATGALDLDATIRRSLEAANPISIPRYFYLFLDNQLVEKLARVISKMRATLIQNKENKIPLS